MKSGPRYSITNTVRQATCGPIKITLKTPYERLFSKLKGGEVEVGVGGWTKYQAELIYSIPKSLTKTVLPSRSPSSSTITSFPLSLFAVTRLPSLPFVKRNRSRESPVYADKRV